MNNTKQTDKIPFSPSFTLASYESKTDGKRRMAEPMARLVLPDMQTAVDFINIGRSHDKTRASNPVTLDYLETIKESPTGEHGQYDAFVRPDRDTSEVHMAIRHYGPHPVEGHKALSEFVMSTIEVMSQNEH